MVGWIELREPRHTRLSRISVGLAELSPPYDYVICRHGCRNEGGSFMDSKPVDSESTSPWQPETPAKRASRSKRAAMTLAVLLLCYLAVAYLIIPFAWERYAGIIRRSTTIPASR